MAGLGHLLEDRPRLDQACRERRSRCSKKSKRRVARERGVPAEGAERRMSAPTFWLFLLSTYTYCMLLMFLSLDVGPSSLPLGLLPCLVVHTERPASPRRLRV